MQYQNTLIIGASGQLGQAILNSGCFLKVLSPSRRVLDITKPETIKDFFEENEVDNIIHCAALADMIECENNPIKAVETNIIGTANMVNEVMKQKNQKQKQIRFLHISTDAVYAGTKGGYFEEGETIPYNKYGWTKLGAECLVRTLSDYCIIRTSFFNPNDIKFIESPIDAFTSKMPIEYLVKAIVFLLDSDFIGVINVGLERESLYEKYKKYKPELKKGKYENVANGLPFVLPRDSSMNLNRWERV